MAESLFDDSGKLFGLLDADFQVMSRGACRGCSRNHHGLLSRALWQSLKEEPQADGNASGS